LPWKLVGFEPYPGGSCTHKASGAASETEFVSPSQTVTNLLRSISWACGTQRCGASAHAISPPIPYPEASLLMGVYWS